MKPVALFEGYTCEQDYINAGVKYISPMLAKELEDEESQMKCLNSSDYFIEEKFDGVRATVHFCAGNIRVFSRRISEKTGWFCENSDSVPHIRDLHFPELDGTILDGEMLIPGRPFKDVSSTLNCGWAKAVARQEEIGKIVFNAFDIVYYKGVRLEMMPLRRRKYYLEKVISALNSEFVQMVTYQRCGGYVCTDKYVSTHGKPSDLMHRKDIDINSYPTLKSDLISHWGGFHVLSPRGFYEYIVATGGEGVIVKPVDGKYYQKRGWEYSKIKKFLTKDVIILGFTDPTDDYKGKFPTVDKWDYWETVEGDRVDLSGATPQERESFKKVWNPNEFRPISKFYCNGWVGNIIFGVIITEEEKKKLPKNKKFEFRNFGEHEVVVVGECSGFDEEQRIDFTENQDTYYGSVIEVKANEIFTDTGKLRHPRFLRLRRDKSPFECTWHDHIGG